MKHIENRLKVTGRDLCGKPIFYDLAIGGLLENDIDVKSYALGRVSEALGQILKPSDIIVEFYVRKW